MSPAVHPYDFSLPPLALSSARLPLAFPSTKYANIPAALSCATSFVPCPPTAQCPSPRRLPRTDPPVLSPSWRCIMSVSARNLLPPLMCASPLYFSRWSLLSITLHHIYACDVLRSTLSTRPAAINPTHCRLRCVFRTARHTVYKAIQRKWSVSAASSLCITLSISPPRIVLLFLLFPSSRRVALFSAPGSLRLHLCASCEVLYALSTPSGYW